MARLVTNKGTEMGIAVGKNLVKQYILKNELYGTEEVKCYLKSGTEFEIYLRNYRAMPVIAQLTINGISQGDGIIIEPKLALYLDRFLTDQKKLVFNTYEASEEFSSIIKSQTSVGKVRLEVYSIKDAYSNNSVTSPLIYGCELNYIGSSSVNSDPYRGGQLKYTPTEGDFFIPVRDQEEHKPTVELGCIEKGSRSNQTFDVDCDWVKNRQLESYSITLLSLNEKPLTDDNTEGDANETAPAEYCSACGRRKGVKKLLLKIRTEREIHTTILQIDLAYRRCRL